MAKQDSTFLQHWSGCYHIGGDVDNGGCLNAIVYVSGPKPFFRRGKKVVHPSDV